MATLRLSGPFVARRVGPSEWRFSTDGDGGPQVLLREVTGETRSLDSQRPDALLLEWEAERVAVGSTDGTVRLVAGSAIVHEPQPALYAALPLAGFDAAARRFWRRIFILIRLPGGRHLVHFLARGRRRKPGAG